MEYNELIDEDKTYDEGCFLLPAFGPDKYYWKVYRRPEYFRTDVKWKDLSQKEQNILLYGSYTPGGERVDKKLEGIYNQFKRLVLMKGPEEQTDYTLKKISQFLKIYLLIFMKFYQKQKKAGIILLRWKLPVVLIF